MAPADDHIQDGHGPERGAAARRRRARSLSTRKRLAFAAITLALVVALLGVLEIALRAAGYGGYPATFRRIGALANGSTLVMTDVDGPVSYFFAARSGGMALDPIAFEMPKPAGTVRVMWIGESAAKGIPQPRPLRASAFLEAMLSDLWPERRVEVLNVGVPGVAAFPVLGVMTESLDYEPDLVVVYLGNNEFYGAYGVASLHSAGQSPGMIRVIRAVRSTAIAQGFDDLLRRNAKRATGAMIETMMGQDSIPPDDPARAHAARNLETFVGDMIDRCAKRAVPIIVCIPPCNERDMAPLGEDDLSGVAPARGERIRETIRALRNVAQEDAAHAEASVRAILADLPDHATAHFHLGRALAAQGRPDEARAEFRRAIDLDRMPWRPPTASVEAIRRAAGDRNAPVADLESAFRSADPLGAPGWALLDDHVHPSLEGQALVARTVVEAMAALPGALRVDAEAIAGLPDWRTYAERLGANVYDAYGVAHTMRMLGSVSFFARSNPAMYDRADALCREIEASLPAHIVQQLHIWTDPERRMVDRFPITGLIADTLLQTGRPEEAATLFEFASRSAQPWSSREIGFTYFALLSRVQSGEALSEADRGVARAAIGRAEFLIANDTREHDFQSGQAHRFAGQLHALLGEDEAAIAHLEWARPHLRAEHRVAADWTLVQAYVRTGRMDEARAIIDDGLEGDHAAAYRQMGAILR